MPNVRNGPKIVYINDNCIGLIQYSLHLIKLPDDNNDLTRLLRGRLSLNYSRDC